MKIFFVGLLALTLLAGVTFADTAEQESLEESAEATCVTERCPGQYEVYKCCGKCYQETCITNAVKCEKECNPGCFCQDGFIREHQGGRCMPKRMCDIYLRRGFNSG
uniref:TIL domain-containing protein n=1 Tax=Anopheles dirus TaxID=7168 RepID=A0A182NFI2_9DIPT